jgi:hypothetical protein
MQKLGKGSYQTVPGEYYGTPKEIWGFRTAMGEGFGDYLAVRNALGRARGVGRRDG